MRCRGVLGDWEGRWSGVRLATGDWEPWASRSMARWPSVGGSIGRAMVRRGTTAAMVDAGDVGCWTAEVMARSRRGRGKRGNEGRDGESCLRWVSASPGG